jgi:hypothetical protein
MILIPFRASHIDAMASLGGQAWMKPYFGDTDPRSFDGLGPAFTGCLGGTVIGCAGIIMCHAQRAIAWALFTDEARRHFKAVHRAVKQFLAHQPVKRLEAYVDCDFAAGQGWTARLGFVLEKDRLAHFLPDGRDASLWVRFN